MKAAIPDLLRLFHKEFELCRIKPGECAVVLAEAGSKQGYIDAAFSALQLLGARVSAITVPTFTVSNFPSGQKGGDLLTNFPEIVEALKKAGFVADVTVSGIVHAGARKDIQAGGARILTILEPPEVLERMAPTPELKKRALAAAALLGKAKLFRATSEAGTDIEFVLGNNPVAMQYGIADEPGRWDHWPSGMVATYPNDGTANGRIVLDRGDIIFPFKSYCADRVVFEIEDGWIKKVDGAGVDADMVRSYFESWHDPDVYATSHVGWGLDHNAQWSAMNFYNRENIIGMDGRSFYGNFLWSTGPNKFVGRETGCHYDIAMRNCSIALDNQTVVEKGRLVYEESEAGTV